MKTERKLYFSPYSEKKSRKRKRTEYVLYTLYTATVFLTVS